MEAIAHLGMRVGAISHLRTCLGAIAHSHAALLRWGCRTKVTLTGTLSFSTSRGYSLTNLRTPLLTWGPHCSPGDPIAHLGTPLLIGRDNKPVFSAGVLAPDQVEEQIDSR